MEAIGEVKVQKSNYGADAGGFGCGIVNIVTKSGTQQYHGDVYEYFRNDKLDARNFFANDRQLIRLNNFGYTVRPVPPAANRSTSMSQATIERARRCR
jgi:hypothetical protein